LVNTTLMKARVFHRYSRFVCHHHLKLVSPLLLLEQVQLDRAFPLEGSLSPDEKEPKLPAPALRLPFLLEESQFPVGRGRPPHPALLHQTLQLRESLERHRNRQFGPQTFQRPHHFVAEKSAVHPNLNEHARQRLPTPLQA